jgi:predicted nucleotidyltransferase
MAIQSITSVESRLEAVYGFGSAFRGEPFRDIDILAVVKAEPSVALDTFYDLRIALENATTIYGAPVHLTMLTEVEFASKPLRCMNAMTLLWAVKPNPTFEATCAKSCAGVSTPR